jgi:hypothetical protein
LLREVVEDQVPAHVDRRVIGDPGAASDRHKEHVPNVGNERSGHEPRLSEVLAEQVPAVVPPLGRAGEVREEYAALLPVPTPHEAVAIRYGVLVLRTD